MFEALRPARTEFAEPAFRWIDPGNYHVTLRFFGDLPRDRIERAARAIAPVAAASAPIDCRIDAFLALPNARRPTVIALALESAATASAAPTGAALAPSRESSPDSQREPQGALEQLAARANAVFEPEFGRPDKPFKAHLTIVRCRRGARLTTRPGAPVGALHFDRIALFESSQAATGVRYSVLEEFVLGAPGRYTAS